MPLILPSLFVNLSCKITKDPTLLPADFKTRDFDTDRHDLHAFISKADLPVYLNIGARKEREHFGITVEMKKRTISNAYHIAPAGQ